MKNRLYTVFYSAIIALMLTACQQTTDIASQDVAPQVELEKPCMGPVKKDTMCTMHYDPVCACNGKTYSNACVAKVAGVLRMEKGACEGDKTAGSDQL